MKQQLMRNVVLSGIQPSGFIHLGNYLGAVQTWVNLQNDQNIHSKFFSIVDYHSITQRYVGLNEDDIESVQSQLQSERPEELTLKTAATLIACGIDAKKSTLFVQSHNEVHTEMMWFLSCLTPLSWLNRMIQFKEKKDSSDKRTSLSLYSYPVLMAADILSYRPNLVPVGEDQTQHLELAKLLAERFNRLFAEDFFPVPEVIKGLEENRFAYNRVMSLQDANKKMSKSDTKKLSCINLIDDPEMIRLKIQRAKTDMLFSSTTDLSNRERFQYNPERPEVANLLRIYAALEGVDYKKVGDLFEEDNAFSFKEKLSTKLIDKLCPIGEKALDLCQNREEEVLEVLDIGAKKATEAAKETLVLLKQNVGILRKNT